MNVRLPGTNASDGLGATPVPESATVCGLDGALSVICRTADSIVAVVGEKVKTKEQFAFGARVARQVVVWEKSVTLGPVILVPGRFSVSV